MSNESQLIIHTDGGSRGNPGPAATGIVIIDSKGSVIHEFGSFIGITTNNVAEYSAVIESLEWIASELKSTNSIIKNINFITYKLDSMLVVEQLNGNWKVKDSNLQILNSKIHNLINSLDLKIIFTYVPRAQNASADFQVNKALDNL